MRVIILNAAPGVGKSTLLRSIESSNLKDTAIIDGDDVGRIIPLNGSDEWLDLIQDNIVACAKNYFVFGVKLLFISFVFPSSDRINRLIGLLKRVDIKDILHLTLICDECEIEKRILQRNTSKLISIERAKELNTMIKDINCDFAINTTKKSEMEIFQEIRTLLLQRSLGL